MRKLAPPPRKCAVAPAGTRCLSLTAPLPPCDWPEVHPPRRLAPRGSLCSWPNPQKTLWGRERTEGEKRAGGGRGQGLVLTVGLGGSSPHRVACPANLLTNEMCALSDYWFYVKLMMGVNVRCAMFASGRLLEAGDGRLPTSKSKNTDSGLNRGRCMGLMSHEIHDAAALYQLLQVRAVYKHSGWTSNRFITSCNSSFVWGCIVYVYMCVSIGMWGEDAFKLGRSEQVQGSYECVFFIPRLCWDVVIELWKIAHHIKHFPWTEATACICFTSLKTCRVWRHQGHLLDLSKHAGGENNRDKQQPAPW